MISNKKINDFHVISGSQVKIILSDMRKETIDIVAQTYLAHERGETANPDSYFLRFPDKPLNRIIALPAAILNSVGEEAVSGIKWIASYPDNIKQGIPRASAVMILNHPTTGYPYALLEGAMISAVRTAASAVLGARWLNEQRKTAASIAIIGGGVIARNIIETFSADGWSFGQVGVHDLDHSSATALSQFVESAGFRRAKILSQREALAADIVVFATSAGTPYVNGEDTFRPGQIVLNISLRDIGPEIVVQSYNFFDDISHCLKANTSPHLTEQKYQHREFITGTLAALIRGDITIKRDKPLIYSPFGMGILDLVLARIIHEVAVARDMAVAIPFFFGEESRW